MEREPFDGICYKKLYFHLTGFRLGDIDHSVGGVDSGNFESSASEHSAKRPSSTPDIANSSHGGKIRYFCMGIEDTGEPLHLVPMEQPIHPCD
jgi:hypothetical protein